MVAYDQGHTQIGFFRLFVRGPALSLFLRGPGLQKNIKNPDGLWLELRWKS